MNEISEEKLLKECIAGNRQYQEMFYQKYCRKMAGVCYRYARNKEESEDFLQDAFIRIFKNLHQFKAKGSLEGWIRRIVINTIMENMRKKSLMFKVVDLEEAEYETLPENFPADVSLHELAGMIQELSPGCRTVFNLFAIEGYSHKEIASMLGIRTGTSKSHYFNAKKLLREKIVNSNREMLIKS